MSEIVETKTSVKGHKNVTSQIIETPFGKINVRIGVSGYKSSEGDQVFPPPIQTDDELDGAEAQAEES